MQVMRLAEAPKRLADYVRLYMHLQGSMGAASLDYPVPARATSLLEFQFGSTNEIHWCNRPLIEGSRRVQIVGLQTHCRVRLRFTGNIDTFMIFFQPTGMHHLFSAPMHELTYTAQEARAVFGAGIDELADRLSVGRSFEGRVCIANAYLVRRSSGCPIPDRITIAAMAILHQRGQIQVPALAEQACMSSRQLERRFIREIGLPPKLYSRIARFESALESKALSSNESWTEITNRLWYFDQMHLIRDFKEFSGKVPTNLISQLEAGYQTHLEEIRSGRKTASSRGAPQLIL